MWFRQWITEGYSVRQLVHQGNYGRDKLYSIINYWLKRPPKASLDSLEQYQHLILDGTFLHRPVSIITLMDGGTNAVISGRYGVSENSDRELAAFFKPLITRGLHPLSCTLDGNPQAIRTIKLLWPGITIQRCLVHIQRQGLSWCRRSPKSASARGLRRLFRIVTDIKTKEEHAIFLELLKQWEERYGRYIAIQPEKGRVFSDIKRARSMLLKAVPDMFHYLDDSSIPFSTNGLEGYFSRLKSHYRGHRGLDRKKLESYFNWYFHFRPR